MCVCVCVRERETERTREWCVLCVCVCACVCVCVWWVWEGRTYFSLAPLLSRFPVVQLTQHVVRLAFEVRCAETLEKQ